MSMTLVPVGPVFTSPSICEISVLASDLRTAAFH